MQPRSRILATRLLIAALSALNMCAPAAAQCQLVELVGDLPLDGFGSTVAVSGNRMVTTSVLDDSYDFAAVHVFERSGRDWVHTADLTPDDARPRTGFGRSPSVSGDRVAAGAPYDDLNGPSTGSAYVFAFDGTAWAQEAKLVADDGDDHDWFGQAIAVNGDTVVVGAPHDEQNGGYSGSAYVFERLPDATWVQTAKLVASDGQPGDEFACCVAISADVIVVGAWDDDDLGWGSGSAYVFERDSNGEWSEVAKLLASNGKFLDGFGYSAAIDGDRALIGAFGADGLDHDEGAVYLFERDAHAQWTELGRLFAGDGDISDLFGIAVALEGDVAVIGARSDDDQGQSSGSAYVFARDAEGSWSQVAKLVPDDGEPWDWFGNRVAVSANIGGIGTFPYDVNEPWKPGKAYIYAVGPDEDGDGVMDACECPGDLNHDWIVGHSDLGMFLASWQLDDGGDCDGDGDTDHADLGILLANWGNVCP